MPGMGELLVILVIVLLIFGAGKLPAIGDALGRSIKNFRRGAAGTDELEVSKSGEIDTARRSELKEGRGDAGRGSGDDVVDAEVVTSKRAAD